MASVKWAGVCLHPCVATLWQGGHKVRPRTKKGGGVTLPNTSTREGELHGTVQFIFMRVIFENVC